MLRLFSWWRAVDQWNENLYFWLCAIMKQNNRQFNSATRSVSSEARYLLLKNELCSARALQTTFHPLGHKKNQLQKCDVMRISCLARRASAKKNLVKIFRIARRDEESRGEWTTEKNPQSGWYCAPATQSKNGKKIHCRREAKRVPDYARSKIVVEGHEFASVERSTGIVGELSFFRVSTRHELDFFSFSANVVVNFANCLHHRLDLFCVFFTRVLEIRFSFSSLVVSLGRFLLLQQCCLRLVVSVVCARLHDFREFADEMK